MFNKILAKLFSVFLRHTEIVFKTFPFREMFESRLMYDLERPFHGDMEIQKIRIIENNGYFEISGLSFVRGSEKVKEFGFALTKENFLTAYKYHWAYEARLISEITSRLRMDWRKEGINFDAKQP